MRTATSNSLERLRADVAAHDGALVDYLAQLMTLALQIEAMGRQAEVPLPIPSPLADLVEALLSSQIARELEEKFCQKVVWHFFHEWERLQRQQRERQLGQPSNGAQAIEVLVASAKTLIIQILQLLADRFKIALKIEQEKRALGQPIHHPDYEQQRLQDLRVEATQHGLDPYFIEGLFRPIFGESRRLQKQQRDAQTATLPDM